VPGLTNDDDASSASESKHAQPMPCAHAQRTSTTYSLAAGYYDDIGGASRAWVSQAQNRTTEAVQNNLKARSRHRNGQLVSLANGQCFDPVFFSSRNLQTADIMSRSKGELGDKAPPDLYSCMFVCGSMLICDGSTSRHPIIIMKCSTSCTAIPRVFRWEYKKVRTMTKRRRGDYTHLA
jgi:hypothetical protein